MTTQTAGAKIIEGLKSALTSAKCAHDLEFLGWTTSAGQMRRCRQCGCRFTDWAGTTHWDATLPGAPPAKSAAIVVKAARAFSEVDAMPPELRQCVHEFGYAIVNACLLAGVTKPNNIRHLVHEIWNGARQPEQKMAGSGQRQGSVRTLHFLDWVLIQGGAGISAEKLVRLLWLKDYVIMPREPIKEAVAASMDAIAGMGPLTKEQKHRIRLRASIKAVVQQCWPHLLEPHK